MKQFNLIFSTYRFKEEDAQDEILDLLESFGDAEAICEITEIKGILLAQSRMDPVMVLERMRQITATEPWQVRYILRALPVMKVVPTTLENIASAAFELSSVITPTDSFRITVEKRHTPLESIDIIYAIGARIDRKVDLDNPVWIVLVQILGAQTGLAVVKPDQIYSSVVEKRK